jgi:glutathione reductase (NADPH)
MERAFDVVIIGSGSAGTNAAMALRKRERSVAVVDERPFGGTCVLRGCDPKKVLVAASHVVADARRYEQIGVLDRVPALNWAHLMQFKRTFTDPVPKQREQTYRDAGIEPIHARARFADAQTLIAGEDRLRAQHIVIASGAEELHVAQGDDMLLTSETFMELESMPKSLIFIGGGYIAFEFAHVAARAGAQITILNDNDTPLRGFDPDIVGQLVDATRKLGIDVQLNAAAERVERTSGRVVVHTKDGKRFEAENGVLAAGRVPNLEHLDLNAGGIERTKKGVKVNEFMQSVSNPNVYAAGDCADGGGLPLTPVAGYEGEIVSANIVEGNSRKPDFRGLASIVYTIPNLGQIGLTEAQAREEGLDVDVHSGDMADWYSTRHVAEDIAMYKAVVDKKNGTVCGVTILGPHAQEQLNVLALGMRYGLRAEQISQALYCYPTGPSDLEYILASEEK